jgi:hypothetical protein
VSSRKMGRAENIWNGRCKYLIRQGFATKIGIDVRRLSCERVESAYAMD